MIPALLLLSSILVATCLPLRAYAARIERGPGPVAEQLHKINRGVFITLVTIGVAAGLVAAITNAATDLRKAFMNSLSVLGDDAAIQAVTVGSIVLLGSMAILATFAAIAPTVRRLRGLERSTVAATLGLARGLALFLGPFTLWLTGVSALWSLVGDTALVFGLGQIAILGVVTTLGPFFIPAGLPTYRADKDTHGRLMKLCARHGLRLRDVRLYRARNNRQANALFVGILPNRRYVYVSDFLLDNFDGPELEAIMAHEIGHGKEHHLLIRIAVFALGILVGSFPGGALPALAIFVYLAFGLGIRLEKRADDYAARTVGPDATIRAMHRLCELNDTQMRTTRLWNVLARHPGAAQRIERLRGTPDSERAEPRSRTVGTGLRRAEHA